MIEVTRRRGRRRKQLLDDIKENYMETERERSQSVEKPRFGRGCGPIIRQTTA
jgi:hypothetical protein